MCVGLLCRARLMAAKASRTSAIYHLGLEGLGELSLENEPEQDVSA